MKNDYLANAKAEHIAQFATEDEEMIIEGAAATSMLPKRPKIELDPARVFQIPKCPTCKKRGGRRCGICGVSGRKTEAGQCRFPASCFRQNLTPFFLSESDPRSRDQVYFARGSSRIDVPMQQVSLPPSLFSPCADSSRRCNRSTHYDCQPRTSGATYEEHVKGYFDHGECNECTTYDLDVDAILAWRQVEVVPEEEDEEEVSLAAIDVVKTKDEVTGKVFVMPSIKDPLAPAEVLFFLPLLVASADVFHCSTSSNGKVSRTVDSSGSRTPSSPAAPPSDSKTFSREDRWSRSISPRTILRRTEKTSTRLQQLE